MEYKFEDHNGIKVLSFSGNMLTGTENTEILAEVKSSIEEGKNCFVVNLGGIKFMNSTGLSLLINILTKSRKAGGEVVLADIPEELNKLLVMTKLNSIFITRDTQDDALEFLRNQFN